MSRRTRWGLACALSCEFLALSLWVGGLIVLIGAVIPAVFNTFGGQDSGGIFLTRSFEGYNRLVMGAIAMLALAMIYRWWSGEPLAQVSRGEVVVLAVMVLIAGVIIAVLHPQAAALQAEAFAAKDEQARKTAFEAFFRLHMPIRSLYMVNLVLGIVLFVMKAKRSLGREGVPA
ncbi:MAG TPA: DUF4149 domain-containing protein [Nitrospira sp.]|nr:DUF4149 domain-containing protein [Nitrospira sp.]